MKKRSLGISLSNLLDKHLNRAPDYKKSYGSDFDITIPIRKPKGDLQRSSKMRKIRLIRNKNGKRK